MGKAVKITFVAVVFIDKSCDRLEITKGRLKILPYSIYCCCADWIDR
jgi:hypothetical protein